MCLLSEVETASSGGRLPSNLESATITQLKELAEHLQDLSTLLQPKG